MTKQHRDTYQLVTDKIIAALEAGTRPWAKPWSGASGGLQMPYRANGQPYRGINVLLLWIAYEERGFAGRNWFTFKQALELGACVRKGETSTQIVFFKKLDATAENDAGEKVDVKIPFARSYNVFNADQIDGLPDHLRAPVPAAASDKSRDEQAEAALRSCGAKIREGGAEAFYVPDSDYIQLPDFERFTSTGGYLCTLAHELCHWTGDDRRLDRKLRNKFGSKDYAAEELVAELGAAMIGGRLGFGGEHIDNHAAYLDHWLQKLRDDKRAIFKAASLAQAAADYVLDGAPAAVAAPARPAAAPVMMPAAPAQFALGL